MSSTSIYMPYFYIIQHKETKIKYAGSRWKNGCNPIEFMKQNGYTTSSPTINNIILNESLDIFEIVDIITLEDMTIPFGTLSIKYYEDWFLQTNDCANSEDWYNTHNNNGFVTAGSEKYKKIFMELYGVDHPMKNSNVVNKRLKSLDKNKEQFLNNLKESWTEDRIESMTGNKNPAYDHTIYNFIHDSGIIESCTRYELYKKYNLTSSKICSLVHKAINQHKGWRLG